MQLKSIFEKYKDFTDKSTIHHYAEAYEEIISGLKTPISNLLEIGVFRGGSLASWEERLPNTNIFGLDKEDKREVYCKSNRVKFILGDCTKKETANNLKDKQFEIVIDDASHYISDQILAFFHFFPLVCQQGIYVIEDVQNNANRIILEEVCSAFGTVKTIDLRSSGRWDDMLITVTKDLP